MTLPNFITRKYHYFAVVKVGTVEKQLGLNIKPEIAKFLNRYFFWRGRKSLYFEPYTNTRQETYVVFGTPEGSKGTINRNCLIFLLEFYASISDPNLRISPDFGETKKTIGEDIIYIYKVKI